MSPANAGEKFKWKQWLAAFAASCPMLSIHLDVVWCSDEEIFKGNHIGYLIRPILLIIGAILGAVIADIFGRKRSLVAMSIVVILAVGFVFGGIYLNLPMWIVMVLMPFGSGITCVLVALYISEISGIKNCKNLMVVQLSVQVFRQLLMQIAFAVDSHGYVLFITYLTVFAGSMIFHLIMMCFLPETPEYLNWKGSYQETERSLTFYRGVNHLGFKRDNSSHVRTEREGCCERIREIFTFDNRRNLAIIFSLIAIRRATGQDYNYEFVSFEINNFYYQSVSFLPNLGVCFTTFIFTILVASIVRLLARKLSLLFVIGILFIATIMGVVRIESEWAIIGVIYAQYLCQIIFIAVTLAYVGEFFPIKIRAPAIALVVIFEVLIRSIISFIYPTIFGLQTYLHQKPTLSIYKCGVVLASFFFVLIFFPKTRKSRSSEYTIRITANHEYSPFRELTPVLTTNPGTA